MKRPAIANTVADWPINERTKCKPVPLREVTISGFLGRRIDNNLKSILAGMNSPIPRGFEARAKGEELPPEANRLAADSDLYKWIEGAAYTYAGTGDAEILAALQKVTGWVASCQHHDGYINTQVPPKLRFDPGVNHDLYIAGHFFEAAVAHHRARGDGLLLNAARRWADYIISEYKAGNPYFDAAPGNFPEHPEYELGFLRLYRETGDRRYLDFSMKLTGFSVLATKVAEVKAGHGLHAVRFGYLLTACADLFIETGAEDLFRHVPGLWEEIARTRMYITGGMGINEAIPSRPYVLPQSIEEYGSRDIAETCASIALMMWTWRMHSLFGQSRFFDVIETILYNHFLGALSLDNMGNFYYNPLRVLGDQTGKSDHGKNRVVRCRLPEIHPTCCCIPNAWRFLGALPEYIFSYDDRGLFVNLYSSGSVQHTLPDGREIGIDIDTDYPHDGLVKLKWTGETGDAVVRLRIPEWCRRATVALPGGKTVDAEPGSYFEIDRDWKSGDEVILDMKMPVRMLFADDRVLDSAGQAVLARGPLVYCLEQTDAAFPIARARLAIHPEQVEDNVQVEWREDLLGGINVLHAPGLIASETPGPTYFQPDGMGDQARLTLIPFYARANRGTDNRWTTYLTLQPL